MALLLREPVLGGPGKGGNEDCWDEDFTYARCCDLSKGIAGDRACWKASDFGYNDCCDVGDRQRKARQLLVTGERYFNAARWLYWSSARKRHFKDALAVFRAAAKFDPLGSECAWLVGQAERAIASLNPSPPPPPPPSRRSGCGRPLSRRRCCRRRRCMHN
jgi:hypothetical protein